MLGDPGPFGEHIQPLEALAQRQREGRLDHVEVAAPDTVTEQDERIGVVVVARCEPQHAPHP
jgi:hypothetical protein